MQKLKETHRETATTYKLPSIWILYLYEVYLHRVKMYISAEIYLCGCAIGKMI